MKQTMKIAKWELKKNLTNKSFLFSLFLTPALFLLFFFIPQLFDDSSESELTTVFLKDDIGAYETIENFVEQQPFLEWELVDTELPETDIIKQLNEHDNQAFVHLDEDSLAEHSFTVYTSDSIDSSFMSEVNVLSDPIKELQLERLELSDEQLAVIQAPFMFEVEETTSNAEATGGIEDVASEEELLSKLVPGIFAGIVLFSIVISGMMIFQSASQEKKEKIAEIILSSVTPNELMQGKIIGYFFLGIIQVAVWLGVAIPVVLWKIDMPVMQYLLVPEVLIFLVIAILGYLFFASLFVGVGATIEDVSTSGNFQGLVIMLPFVQFIFFGPLFSNPDGILAKVLSFIPFTAPGTLIIRLSLLDQWPWIEIISAIVVLFISVLLFMRLAGKIFKTGILMYGKNATPKEILKWMMQ
ncbi:MAG TPA: ABC transporter permease [Bacillota bacterium]|nr:ABC transporter permease [Bacillota bacterium]